MLFHTRHYAIFWHKSETLRERSKRRAYGAWRVVKTDEGQICQCSGIQPTSRPALRVAGDL